MNKQDFLRNIYSRPGDMSPRLEYIDYLLDAGEEKEAEFWKRSICYYENDEYYYGNFKIFIPPLLRLWRSFGNDKEYDSIDKYGLPHTDYSLKEYGLPFLIETV